jgi:hypothetical protein
MCDLKTDLNPLRSYGGGLLIICSIAAHAGPRGSVQPVAEHHPSASATEPAGSSCTPVGSGELNSGVLWADADVHSSIENARANRQIPDEYIAGVPQGLGTTNAPIADGSASIRLGLHIPETAAIESLLSANIRLAHYLP